MSASPIAAALQQPTFFERVKTELKRLFRHAPGWEASAAATLTYVAPMIEALLAITEPAAAPVVDALIAKVQSAMAAAAVVIKTAGPTPTLETYLNAITSDLAQLEASCGIEDSATLTKVNALITTISGEVNAVLAEVAGAKAA